jgi:hypothetical protein
MRSFTLCSSIAVIALIIVLIAGCTAPTTTNTTPSPSTTTPQSLAASLNAQISARYQLLENFTIVPQVNGSSFYTGVFQEQNGTAHVINLYPANSSKEARQQFEAQKTAYSTPYKSNLTAPANQTAAALNMTVIANTTTHWEATIDSTTTNVWYGEPNTSGPFGLRLDVPYVVVSQDLPEVYSALAT